MSLARIEEKIDIHRTELLFSLYSVFKCNQNYLTHHLFDIDMCT